MDSWINWGNTKPKRRLNPWEQYGAGNTAASVSGWDTPANALSGESIGIDRGPAGYSTTPSGPGVKLPSRPPTTIGIPNPSQYTPPNSTMPVELGPGGQPYHGPGSGADNSWQNWWTGTGLPGAYNPNWSLPVTPGATGEENTDPALLSWINAMLPYMSAQDRVRYVQQAMTGLDPLDDEGAYKYFSGLATQLAPAANSAMGELGNYWDRERLREMRRANREFWSNYSGGEENATGWELQGGQLQNLFNAILGSETAGGNEGSIWDTNGPLSRRDRRNYYNTVDNYASGMDTDFAQILQSLMYPTTNSPRLNAYFRAPSTYQGSYPGSSYTYGSQNVRWV